MRRLAGRYQDPERRALFEGLRPLLSGAEPFSFASLSADIGLAEGALRVAAHRLNNGARATEKNIDGLLPSFSVASLLRRSSVSSVPFVAYTETKEHSASVSSRQFGMLCRVPLLAFEMMFCSSCVKSRLKPLQSFTHLKLSTRDGSPPS